MTTFDIQELINDELASSAVTDPVVLAEHIAKRVPARHLRDALADALCQTVRLSLATERRQTQSDVARAMAGKSTRWADAADMYRALLGQRIEVGENGREWKFLGDCTCADLMVAVNFRRRQAAGLTATADRYQAVAALLDKHGKSIVSELPTPEVVAVFS